MCVKRRCGLLLAGENKYRICGRHAAEPLTTAHVSMRTSGDRERQMSIPSCPRSPIASDAVGVSPPPPSPSSLGPVLRALVVPEASGPRSPWPRPTSTRLSYSINITIHSRDVVLQAIRDEFHAAALLRFLNVVPPMGPTATRVLACQRVSASVVHGLIDSYAKGGVRALLVRARHSPAA